MFEQAFKNIDNVLWKDAGCGSEIDYIEQTSWILFLRYIDDLELEKKDEAELKGQSYQFIIDESYRWINWAMPKNPDGSPNHNEAMTGEDLVNFVNRELFLWVIIFGR